MSSLRFMTALSIAATLAFGATASAQWDPESGDTGDGWEAPPEQPAQPAQPQQQQQQQQQQPAPQQPAPQPQPQPQQQPNAWQQPPAQPQQPVQPQQPQQPQQNAWYNGDQERPPAMGGTPAEPDAPAGNSDHDQVGFGLSFFGVNSVNVTPAGANVGELSMPLPTVGIRYWFGNVGLDFGVGLGTTSRKEINSCTDVDACSMTERIGGIDGGFAIGAHIGLPIAISTGEHWALLAIPEIDFAYGTASIFQSASDTALDISLSGIQFDVGVRFGGEFHFGGIGLPNLSLQATIGLGLRYAASSAANNVAFGDPRIIDFESNSLSIRTIANDLLNGLVRINYYF